MAVLHLPSVYRRSWVHDDGTVRGVARRVVAILPQQIELPHKVSPAWAAGMTSSTIQGGSEGDR